MQFVPDTIDALSRLYHETGIGGFVILTVALAVFMLVLAVVLILTRHTGALVDVAKEWLHKTDEGNTSLKEIAMTNQQIMLLASDGNKLTQEVKERVGKLPSDVPVCRARSDDEIRKIIREEMSRRGSDFTEAELETIMRQRHRVKEQMEQERP